LQVNFQNLLSQCSNVNLQLIYMMIGVNFVEIESALYAHSSTKAFFILDVSLSMIIFVTLIAIFNVVRYKFAEYISF
jgi:hypothetical protein